MLAHFCKSNNIEGGVLIVDQEKAYDSVKHQFLADFLPAFGIGRNFRRMIMLCYHMVFSAIKMKGHYGEFFYNTKGVRQGCPLSCLLFDLCMETLSCTIKKNIKGIPLDSPHLAKAPNIGPKFFADDAKIAFSLEDEKEEIFV